MLNHFRFRNHLPVHEIKVSRTCVSDKSWKMKCLSTVLDSRSFPEPVTSRSVPMHVYINTCFKPWNQPSSVVWCFDVLLFWRRMWFWLDALSSCRFFVLASFQWFILSLYLFFFFQIFYSELYWIMLFTLLNKGCVNGVQRLISVL